MKYYFALFKKNMNPVKSNYDLESNFKNHTLNHLIFSNQNIRLE